MFSFVPPAIGEPTRVVDTFERTSHDQVRDLSNSLQRAYEEDRGKSRVRELLEKFDLLSNALNDLYRVPDDWNAYGSPSPTKPAIEISRGILNSLSAERLPPERVLPSADGGVALVFVTDTENRAVIETLNDNSVFVLLYDRRGNSKTLVWNESGAVKHEILKQLGSHLKGAPLAAD
jgi:hypothetical protein